MLPKYANSLKKTILPLLFKVEFEEARYTWKITATDTFDLWFKKIKTFADTTVLSLNVFVAEIKNSNLLLYPFIEFFPCWPTET